MARPNKLLRHNILIVCEGESTEPHYFNNLIPLAKAAWAETLNFLLNTSENYRIMIAL